MIDATIPSGNASNSWLKWLATRKSGIITAVAVTGIASHLILRFALGADVVAQRLPLLITLIVGGGPLIVELVLKFLRREFGSDLLGGIAIATALALDEYLAGSIIVLMLSGGEALEQFALQSASSVLAALAQRMPSVAHRKNEDGTESDVSLEAIAAGDTILLYPHDICPVDGEVMEGRSVMDESYLTGEPFKIPKTSGSSVISGAINGEGVLTIQATKRAVDSRYAKIMEVMRESEAKRPQLRRLGDQLGAVYTPVALAVALLAWAFSGEATRFLAVLVIATPCPLLIGIPVAIIGSVSLCARRAIIIKSPVVLEQVVRCRTAIFDKTGTLTYGEPKLTEILTTPEYNSNELLSWAASLERYSKHPLARAILKAAEEAGLQPQESTDVREPSGQGLIGIVDGRRVQITSRNKLVTQKGADDDSISSRIPPVEGGLECVIAVEGDFAALLRFRDAPRAESRSFVQHLGPSHQFDRVLLLSGDRESEVRYLSQEVGIKEIHAQKSPEEKLALVREISLTGKTLYVGDGINDAPAMMAATVGVAIGQNSDVTAEAAGAVILDNSLRKVDEFLHISRRMRTIALQSAVGGMALSLLGMGFAAAGYLDPVTGAICQEVIDVLAVLNALRAAFPPREISHL